MHIYPAKKGTGIRYVPFAPGLRDQLHKIPEAAFGKEFPCFRISRGCPFRGESHLCGDASFFAFCDDDDAFFGESFVGVFQGFFVDCFEVREVSLVVECFTELITLEWNISLCVGERTNCALFCALLRSIQASFCPSRGGVSPRRDTVPSHEASINGQMRKQ
jgi:hypothetical protein